MKKIIAAAVATAFVAPAFAADITISGEMESTYLSGDVLSAANALTAVNVTDTDGEFNIVATEELGNGISVKADFLISDSGSAEGGESLTVSGPFGSVDMGDVNSAADSIDDVTEFGIALGRGTSSPDADINWTLPAIAPGLKVVVSHSPDGSSAVTLEEVDSTSDPSAYLNSNGTTDAALGGRIQGSTDTDANGLAVQYSFGPGSIGYATLDSGDGKNEKLFNATFTTMGATIAYENWTQEQSNTSEKTTAAIGAKYTTGPITLVYESAETDTDGTVATDITMYGVQYAMGGVTFYAETSEEDVNNESITALGAIFKF